MSKAIATEVIFWVVLGLVAVAIVVYVLLVQTGILKTSTWTELCRAKQKVFCSEGRLRGDYTWMAWSEYAPDCPDWTPTESECASII